MSAGQAGLLCPGDYSMSEVTTSIGADLRVFAKILLLTYSTVRVR